MNHGTHGALPPDLAARLAEQTNPRAPQVSAIMRAAQFGCGRWLAHFREQLQLTVAELAARTELDARVISWVEEGLGSPALMTDDERARFAEVLAEDESDDIASIAAVLEIALGAVAEPSPQIMAWVVEDLGFEGIAMQPVGVVQEDDEPTTLAGLAVSEQMLDLDVVLVLLSLANGERHSYTIWQDVAARRPAGEQGFDNATCLALIARGVDEGWIEALDERFDAALGMARRYFRLTGTGREVLATERQRLVNLGDRSPWTEILREWLAGLGGGQPFAPATLVSGASRRSR